MPKLVISLATRGRPQQLMETVRRSVANWTHPETVMVIQADQDDFPTMIAAQALNTENPRILCTVAPREDTIAAKWNRAVKLDPNADLYLVAADDDPYITPGYDTRLIEGASRFSDGIGMVYGHLANASFSGVVAPTRGLVEKVGHVFPEYFPYWFCDHWTDDIARLIGRISFADVRTDQSKAGQTQEMREPAWWATWFDAAYLMRRKIARNIIWHPDFQETEQRKDMLMAHEPLIESRSRWVNDNVRAQFKHWFGAPAPDDRYARVKAKAIEMIPQLLEGMPEQPDPGVLGSWGANGYRVALGLPTQVPALPQAPGVLRAVG
jgi:hypothetical protein